jgi:fumarate hydratase class I
MATPEFVYQDPFPLEKDDTRYRLLTKEYVSVTKFDGKEILKIEPEALTFLANEAIRDVSFLLRSAHLQKVAAILKDPAASDNDRFVALAMLRNADTASKGILPFCQDTGTATIFAKKGQRVWTGAKDEEHLAKGIYKTYTEENLRYSQTAPLDMYNEVDTGTNLPAQIDIFATEGMDYSFLFVAKGGGSANKTTLYQETKALLNPGSLEKFLSEKMKTLGTAGCPPYHLAFVVGGTSAEACLKTVKLATTGYLDHLPTSGNARKTGCSRRRTKPATARSLAASTSRSTCVLSVYPGTAPPARWAWECLARRIETSKEKSTKTASGWKNSSGNLDGSYRRSFAARSRAAR